MSGKHLCFPILPKAKPDCSSIVFERRKIKKGEYLYKEKTISEQGFYILEKGEVLLIKLGKRAATIRPGGYFSDLSAIALQ